MNSKGFSPKIFPLFKVLSLHGLKGDLKVALLSSNEDLLSFLKEVYLPPEENPIKVLKLKKGPGFNVFILSLEGYNSLEKAKKLLYKTLYIKAETLPQLEEEEFYFHQLENLEVVDERGTFWGKVSEIMPVGEYILLLIKKGSKEFYLPFVEEYVQEVDLKEKRIKTKDLRALVESQEK